MCGNGRKGGTVEELKQAIDIGDFAVPPPSGTLHHGHLLSVRSDRTHHLILDKCVSNIRMNTLLQVGSSSL